MYISFARSIVYSSLVYSSPIKPIASAVRSDCVRCPTVIPALLHCTNELKK